MKKLKYISILLPLSLLLSLSTAHATTFDEFVKLLKTSLFTSLGSARLFGYSSDFAYAEVTGGAFKEGDLVVIKGKGAPNVPVELYEEVAYGEVEGVKGKVIKVYITRRFKEMPKEGIVTGLNKIYVNLVSNDDIDILFPFFLAEKDIQLVDRAEKANVRVFLQRQENVSFSYKLVGNPSGRVLSAGNLTLAPGLKAATPAPSGKDTPVQLDKAVRPELPGAADVAYDPQTGNYWLMKSGVLFCHNEKQPCDRQIRLEAKHLNMFIENNNLVLWLDNGKSLLMRGMNKEVYFDGFLTQGSLTLYDISGNRLYDIKQRERPLVDELQGVAAVYYYKDNRIVTRDETRLIFFEGRKPLREIALNGSELIRVKGDMLYIFLEQRESVPLAGDDLSMSMRIIDIKNPASEKKVPMSESLRHFDVDEGTGEIIFVKGDGKITRVKL